MVEQIGNLADPVGLIVRLGTTGPISVRVGQNIMSCIGEASHGPGMAAMDLTSSREVDSIYQSGPLREAGVLGFAQGLQAGYFVRVMGAGFETASADLNDGQSGDDEQPAGKINAANDGVVGNSAVAVIADGTFKAHDVEYFPGDGTAGPYYLKHHNLIGPSPATGGDKNWVTVNAVPFTCVYTAPELVSGTVYVNKATGSLTFFAGEEPSEYAEIECNIAYKTKKLTLLDGNARPEIYDNLTDQVAIEAATKYSIKAHYEADPVYTHLPVNGTYQLSGGADGAAITEDDWDEAIWVLRDKLAQTLTGTTTLTLCTNMVEQDDSYDLIPVLDGHLREMEQEFMPCLGFIGMKQNEDESVAIQVTSNFSNRNLTIVANPWGGERQEPRTNGWVARAAIEASLPLGASAAERSSLNSIKGMMGLLNTYRKETVTALHNRRLDVLVKTDAGLFPYYARSTAYDWQFAECVDNRTVNYVLVALKYICDRYYFKKNTPNVRASFKTTLANVLNTLIQDEVVDRYTLEVDPVPGEKGQVKVHLQLENVGHIKQFIVDFDVGIVNEYGHAVITAMTLPKGAA
jgi:hypothetical protein